MTQGPDRHATALLYKAVETVAGTNLHAQIQCFGGKPGQGSVTAFRTSAPSVRACRYGFREVVPGSVLKALRNTRISVKGRTSTPPRQESRAYRDRRSRKGGRVRRVLRPGHRGRWQRERRRAQRPQG